MMNLDESKKILDDHREWCESEGVAGKRAKLQGADLQGADLQGANLQGAKLQVADLQVANLQVANLRGADLQGADLRGAKLQGADLQVANLQGADLRGADLQGADLRGADLRGANLQVANLRGAELQGADLRGADLRGAENLDPEKISAFQICPEEGEFTAYKKVVVKGLAGHNEAILKLRILSTAQRISTPIGRKCRASAVSVLAWSHMDGSDWFMDQSGILFLSLHDLDFTYQIGQIVSVDDFDPDIRVECTRGIHFFMTRREAEEY